MGLFTRDASANGIPGRPRRRRRLGRHAYTSHGARDRRRCKPLASAPPGGLEWRTTPAPGGRPQSHCRGPRQRLTKKRLRLADIFSNIRGIRAAGESSRPPVAGVRTVTETGQGARPPRPARPSAFCAAGSSRPSPGTQPRPRVVLGCYSLQPARFSRVSFFRQRESWSRLVPVRPAI